MNSPAKSPATLVNLKTIPNLSYIKEEGGMLKIGALTTLSTIAANTTVQTNYTALAQAAGAAATPELRNQGTIGGNICQKVECWYFRADDNLFNCLRKDPKGLCYAMGGDNRYHSIFGGVSGCFAVNPSDTAAALAAFGASIVTNKKTWAIKDFFAVNGENTTALAADEIVTEIQVPTPAAGTKSAFTKFALRKSFDFPIVNCAAVITQASGSVSAAGIALNAVYNLPRKATEAENSIKGKAINTANADAAGTAAVSGATAMPANANTTTIGNKYMIQIAKVLVKRTILACA
jgi:xanthine dehydrogenase YagS FAD-binding subunit